MDARGPDVKFTQTQYMVANSVETRVKPVEDA